MSDDMQEQPIGAEVDHPMLGVIEKYVNEIYRPPFTTLVREPGRVTFADIARDDDYNQHRYEIIIRKIAIEPWVPKGIRCPKCKTSNVGTDEAGENHRCKNCGHRWPIEPEGE